MLNYLPVVRLADWLAVDGLEILLDRISSDVRARIENTMRSNNLPLSLLYSQSYREILEKIFLDADAGKELKKASEKFAQTVDLHDRISQATGNTDDLCKLIDSEFPAFINKLIRELVKGTLAGYYFLPRAIFDEDPNGLVALLREVNSLPRSLAWLVARGAEENDVFPEELRSHLSFFPDIFAMPVGEVPSPQIEHLMQVFSNLFARIGLRDYSPDFVSAICETPFKGVK